MNKDISNFNDELREKKPSEIIKWALEKSKNPILTTNFRPYEAAIIHLCTKVMPDIKVVWCDSGYNTKATYIYAEKRMCCECKSNMDFIHNSSRYIYIFTNLPLTFQELYSIRLVNKEWCRSINTILSFYKSVQYKLPSQKFSKLERQLMWNHRYEFVGHFQLITKCLSSFENGEKITELENLVKYYEKNKRKYRCNDLACGRNCSSRPKIEEILEI